MASLCPGYAHVQEFGADDEYEDDTEQDVEYVTLDLGCIEPTLVPSSATYRLIGLDTPTPFLQLSGTILKGRHESLLGTELLFVDAKDPHDPAKKTVTHVASTEKRICFREVRLQPKGTAVVPTVDAAAGSGVGKGKGKGREMDVPLEGWAAEAEAAAVFVDRVSGKSVPRARAVRRSGRKGRQEEEEEGEG